MCGAVAYSFVTPNQHDRDAIERELLDAAELVISAIGREHPAAVRLRNAWRNVELAREGRLGF